MATPVNGAVPAQFLAPLDGSNPVAYAELNTAAAFNRLHAAHPEMVVNGPAGGYWTRAVDEDIHANPTKYGVTDKNLSPIGQSPHGLGIRLNIERCNAGVAAQFGFSQFNAYTYTYTGALSWNEAPANSRTAKEAVKIRDAASIHGNQVGTLPAGDSITPSGYLDAEAYPGGPPYPGQTSLWFYVVGVGYFWAGAFTDPTGTNLYNGQHDYESTHPVPAPAAVPAPTPAPVLVATPAPVEAAPAPAQTTTPPTPVAPTPLPAPVKESPTVSTTTPAKPPALTQAQLDSDAAALNTDATQLATVGDSGAPLAGLLAGSPIARKRIYYVYAGAALVISCGSDVVTYGIIPTSGTEALIKGVGLATSILLKIGAAFGFVAASNTK